MECLRQLSERAGHELNTEKIQRDVWITASHVSHSGTNDLLKAAITYAIDPDRIQAGDKAQTAIRQFLETVKTAVSGLKNPQEKQAGLDQLTKLAKTYEVMMDRETKAKFLDAQSQENDGGCLEHYPTGAEEQRQNQHSLLTPPPVLCRVCPCPAQRKPTESPFLHMLHSAWMLAILVWMADDQRKALGDPSRLNWAVVVQYTANPLTPVIRRFVAHSSLETPMVNLHSGMILCLFLGLASPVLAEREVHVVSVGEGYQTDDYYALPEARVLVDRPGKDVGLVLLDGGELHWQVEATAGTIISEIVRSGPSPDDSEVTLSGIPMSGEQISGLPLVFRPWGRDFRRLVNALADTLGTKRISSFQGVHKVNKELVRVDHVDTTTAGLARDYLSQLLDVSDDLPPEIRNWIEVGGGNEGFALAFDESGISLTGPAGTRRFPTTPHVPDILMPVVGVYDPSSQMIYCITYGGEGYLYSVDVQTGEWAVVTSLDEYDAAGLLYDPESRLLITTGAFSRPGEIKVFGLDGSRSSTFVPTTAFPGLTDLFDYGNEHGPPLTPHVFSNGWLLLEALASRDSAYPDTTGEYRIYAVLVATGEVRLLRFSND